MDLKDHIRHIPDFPKPGILFYDISTLLAHPEAWAHCVDRLTEVVAPHQPQVLAGVESRGFLVAAPLALKLGCGFVMVRKKGRSEEHTSELQSLMRISYAVFCLKKKQKTKSKPKTKNNHHK